MPTQIDELNLSDEELLEVLKNHGLSRRTLMQALGAGAGVAALGGTAAGSPGRGNRVDDNYGEMYAADENVPPGRVDHVVELHTHGVGGDGAHEGFPVPDDAIGPAPDENDFDDYPEYHFEPVGLHAKPGDTVQFKAESPLHTVTSYSPKFNEGDFLQFPDRVPVDFFTSALLAKGDSWLYQFTEKGVYDILCLPHESLGMVMRVFVSDPEEDEPDDYSVPGGPEPPNPAPAANAVLNDSELELNNIFAEGEIAWDELNLEGPPKATRSTVETFSVTEVGSNKSDAQFEVGWGVANPAKLDTIRLTLNRNNETVDITCATLDGSSDSGTTTLVAAGGEGSGNEYTVELVVTGVGPSTTRRKTVTES